MKMLLVAALAVAALVLPASGAAHKPVAGSDPLAWTRFYTNVMSWNDLQSTSANTVYNRTGCVWNDMDETADRTTGRLGTGQTTSDSMCLITDYCSDGFCPHMVLFEVDGGSGLQVTLTSDRGGVWQSLPPVKSGGSQVYELCVADPVWLSYPTDYPPIPDSNGGVGYLTRYTLRVSASKTSQVEAWFDIAPNHSEGEFGYTRQLADVPCPTVS